MVIAVLLCAAYAHAFEDEDPELAAALALSLEQVKPSIAVNSDRLSSIVWRRPSKYSP